MIEDAKPPLDVVRDMLATPEPPLPPLVRITESPVFAADGSLQTMPGYHRASKTYYAPTRGFTVPDVPMTPTKSDIQRARALIDEMLVDFKFVEQDKAHAIALFLHTATRDLINGPTPNHLIEAPTAGSGKGLLADALLRPSAGRHIGTIPEAPGGR